MLLKFISLLSGLSFGELIGVRVGICLYHLSFVLLYAGAKWLVHGIFVGSGVMMCITGCMYCIPVLVHIASSDVHVCRSVSTGLTSTLVHLNV